MVTFGTGPFSKVTCQEQKPLSDAAVCSPVPSRTLQQRSFGLTALVFLESIFSPIKPNPTGETFRLFLPLSPYPPFMLNAERGEKRKKEGSKTVVSSVQTSNMHFA